MKKIRLLGSSQSSCVEFKPQECNCLYAKCHNGIDKLPLFEDNPDSLTYAMRHFLKIFGSIVSAYHFAIVSFEQKGDKEVIPVTAETRPKGNYISTSIDQGPQNRVYSDRLFTPPPRL